MQIPHQLISSPISATALERLRTNKSKISDNHDIQHALLLMTIQDDSFDYVYDSILEHPSCSVDLLLSDLSEKDTSYLQLKDGPMEIQGDGTVHSCCTLSTNTVSKGRTTDAVNTYYTILLYFCEI